MHYTRKIFVFDRWLSFDCAITGRSSSRVTQTTVTQVGFFGMLVRYRVDLTSQFLVQRLALWNALFDAPRVQLESPIRSDTSIRIVRNRAEASAQRC